MCREPVRHCQSPSHRLFPNRSTPPPGPACPFGSAANQPRDPLRHRRPTKEAAPLHTRPETRRTTPLYSETFANGSPEQTGEAPASPVAIPTVDVTSSGCQQSRAGPPLPFSGGKAPRRPWQCQCAGAAAKHLQSPLQLFESAKSHQHQTGAAN